VIAWWLGRCRWVTWD